MYCSARFTVAPTLKQQDTSCEDDLCWEILIHISKTRLERGDCQKIRCAVPRDVVERVEFRRYLRNSDTNDVHIKAVEHSAETKGRGDDEKPP